ncbi:gas vesicle protein GvpJ [Dolichospermum circinale]|uniref:gas vesicle protein GvpJ n=1 Tax=Dolichospermum circinale TaxID=109265 RepID=UPI001E5A4BF5|nr:gas vesicle protein GvpJ [Dolichospermum circinale]MDB9474895.1 gas vesicle protein [Dolichospermum circinale CS-537/11]MDB9478552.1 gas vesicle protein [Dolichospermum circinale CS-537/03]
MNSNPTLPTRHQTNSSRTINTSTQGSTLADILERVLDKGIVIAGDISISIASTELINIRIRLLISSVDKAKEMGINWWENDPYLSAKAQGLVAENEQLRNRLETLESKLNLLTSSSSVKEEIPLPTDTNDDFYQEKEDNLSPLDAPIEVLDFQSQTSQEDSSPVDTQVEIVDFQVEENQETPSSSNPTIEITDFQSETSEETSPIDIQVESNQETPLSLNPTIEITDFQPETSEETSAIEPTIDL